MHHIRNKIFYKPHPFDIKKYTGFSFQAVLPSFLLSGAFYYNNFLLGIGSIGSGYLILYLASEKFFFDFRMQEIYRAGYKKWTKCWFHLNFTAPFLLATVFSFLYWKNMVDSYWHVVHLVFFCASATISGWVYFFYVLYTWGKLINSQEIFDGEDK